MVHLLRYTKKSGSVYLAVLTGLEPATLGVTGRYSKPTELQHYKNDWNLASVTDFYTHWKFNVSPQHNVHRLISIKFVAHCRIELQLQEWVPHRDSNPRACNNIDFFQCPVILTVARLISEVTPYKSCVLTVRRVRHNQFFGDLETVLRPM